VLPRRTDITVEKVQEVLEEMRIAGLIQFFQHNGDWWQCWPGFADNQAGLRADREKTGFPEPCNDAPASSPQSRGDDVRIKETNINEEKGKEKKRSKDAGASGEPSTFPEWQERLSSEKNKPAVIMEMCDKLYPKNDKPTFGHIGRAIKTLGGAGRLLDLLWRHSSRPPTGNPVQFVQGVAKRQGPENRKPPVNEPRVPKWHDRPKWEVLQEQRVKEEAKRAKEKAQGNTIPGH
jgi:hypothetical protein